MVVRSQGARLAVLLSIPISFLAFAALVVGLAVPAPALDDGCVLTPDGIDCSYHGSTTSTLVTVKPPIRYLATTDHPTVGPCWYWSRWPPGLDSWDPANDQWIILTRLALPECPTGPPVVTTTVVSRAWEVFRSFPLREPDPRLRPTIGITNLASVLAMGPEPTLSHRETLPDGRVLEVEAFVGLVHVSWGDGSPPFSYAPSVAFAGGAAHTYRLKTCSPDYRRDHPAGRNCHPELESYPVSIAYSWTGRYRTGGDWIVLGTLQRERSIAYDVDEVVGIPIGP